MTAKISDQYDPHKEITGLLHFVFLNKTQKY